MTTQIFINLIELLEELQWEYSIVDGMISVILGDEEIIINKHEDGKLIELIDEIKNNWC
jgi:hypothetical protein